MFFDCFFCIASASSVPVTSRDWSWVRDTAESGIKSTRIMRYVPSLRQARGMGQKARIRVSPILRGDMQFLFGGGARFGQASGGAADVVKMAIYLHNILSHILFK